MKRNYHIKGMPLHSLHAFLNRTAASTVQSPKHGVLICVINFAKSVDACDHQERFSLFIPRKLLMIIYISFEVYFREYNKLPLKDSHEHHVLIVDVPIATLQHRGCLCLIHWSQVLSREWRCLTDQQLMVWWYVFCTNSKAKLINENSQKSKWWVVLKGRYSEHCFLCFIPTKFCSDNEIM